MFHNWELKSSVVLNKVERANVKRKMREVQKKCRAKGQNLLTSVAEASTVARKLLDSVGGHISLAKHATRVIHGKKHEV